MDARFIAPMLRAMLPGMRWIAQLRAQESARPDALFRDPFAAELTYGAKPAPIPRGAPVWPIITRIKLIDELVLRAVSAGVDCVVNLAAGLDTRPYRMDLPAALRWVEADVTSIIDYKSRILAAAKPHCGVAAPQLLKVAVGAGRPKDSAASCELDARSVAASSLLEARSRRGSLPALRASAAATQRD